MKTILLSLALVASLIFGSTMAFADTSAQPNKPTHPSMSGPSGKADNGKGLDKPLIVGNGQESWILHQPVERYPQYFTSSVDQKVVDDTSHEQKRSRS